jgi:hypothetical protein
MIDPENPYRHLSIIRGKVVEITEKGADVRPQASAEGSPLLGVGPRGKRDTVTEVAQRGLRARLA